MQELKNDIWILLCKIWVWVVLILIGIVAKLSYDISMKKKFTFATFISTIALAAFVGYLASVFCIYKDWINASKFIVPLATLMSKELLQIIIANAHKWFHKFFIPPKDNE